jgi:hypothetical protein
MLKAVGGWRLREEVKIVFSLLPPLAGEGWDGGIRALAFNAQLQLFALARWLPS